MLLGDLERVHLVPVGRHPAEFSSDNAQAVETSGANQLRRARTIRLMQSLEKRVLDRARGRW
jgi:hypothetical protein